MKKVFMLMLALMLIGTGCSEKEEVKDVASEDPINEVVEDDEVESSNEEISEDDVTLEGEPLEEEALEEDKEEVKEEKKEDVKVAATGTSIVVKEEPKTVTTTKDQPKATPTPVKKEEPKPAPTPAPVKKEEPKPAPTPPPVKEEPKPTPAPAPAPVKEEPKTIDLYDIFPIVSTSGLSKADRLKAHNETMEMYEHEYYVKQLNREISKYIQGTFNWDYKNKNNRNTFLSFRGGGSYYENAMLSADVIYDKMHKKISDHQLTITSSFDYSLEDIFIHPTRGNYVVSGTLKLKFNSDNGSTVKGFENNRWYSVRYEVGFGFVTLRSTDNWARWNYGDYGLLLKSGEYRIGNFQ